MATYTAPTTRTTGALISASIWNTDIVENIKYFKDAPVFDGDISVGDDLLLPSTGAVINFASGDVTITHGTNTLTFAGAASGYVFNDGNVGIGVTPKTFSIGKAVEIGAAGNIAWGNGGSDLFVASNLYYNTDFKYAFTNAIAAVRLQDGIIKFLTSPSGTADTTATLTEHARVNNAGELLIGYTVDQGAYLLQVNSQIFATNATIATSDGRFKTDVQPVREGLAAVNALQPVQFKWKKHPVHNFIDGTDVGFIAQDVRAALAGRDYTGAVVTQNGSGDSEFLGMADSKLIPLLVAAVQELSAEVNALKAH